MTKILVASLTILYLCLAGIPVSDKYTDLGVVAFNILLIIIILGVAVLMLVEGRKVQKLIDSFYIGTDDEAIKKREVTTTITRIVTGCSVGYSLVIGVLIIFSIVRSLVDSFDLCMANHFIYRLLELGMMTLLTY